MLGVKLFGSYTKTRQDNCEDIVNKIKKKIDFGKQENSCH